MIGLGLGTEVVELWKQRMIQNLGRKSRSESLNQSPEKMKLKQLEGLLGGLQQFPQPKVELEQYPTGPHIASRMLFTVFPHSLYSPSFFISLLLLKCAKVGFFCLIPRSSCCVMILLGDNSDWLLGFKTIFGAFTCCSVAWIRERRGGYFRNPFNCVQFCSFSINENQAENSFGDVSDKVVADFGCGCGTLGVAAALLNAEHVLSIDIDPESLEIASLNAEELELDIDFIQSNILDLGWRGPIVDTVIMNPPFGTRKVGADLDFLSVALKVASQAVYSLHKTSTRDHVKRTALRDFNASSAEAICELRFDVPKMYKFHKKKEVDIAVDLWRFVPARHQRST
ncbi:hypothetical protein ACSQ67_009509 [Phaseolus vulgaris]